MTNEVATSFDEQESINWLLVSTNDPEIRKSTVDSVLSAPIRWTSNMKLEIAFELELLSGNDKGEADFRENFSWTYS